MQKKDADNKNNFYFGKVKFFTDKGFGFIETNVLNLEIFFHVNQIKDEKIKAHLEQFSNDNWDEDQHPLFFWFEAENTQKGPALSCCVPHIVDVQTGTAKTIIDDAIKQLLKLKHCSPVQEGLLKWAYSNDFISNSDKQNILELIINHTNNQKLLCILPSEEQSKISLIKRKQLIEKYRNDPSGIRNEEKMRHVCLKCGSNNAEYKFKKIDKYKPVLGAAVNNNNGFYSLSGYQRCQECAEEWYINHCWSCKNGRVDDRDPVTPRCSECSWCKCDKCTACCLHGCSTTPYSKNNRYTDSPELLKKQNVEHTSVTPPEAWVLDAPPLFEENISRAVSEDFKSNQTSRVKQSITQLKSDMLVLMDLINGIQNRIHELESEFIEDDDDLF
nr:cold shock domain-containing protein [Moritella viscosa]SHO18081.1 Putative uncharacterized protein [Moritella viscosa]